MRRNSMKNFKSATIVILAAFLSGSLQTGCTKPPSPEELKASIELLDVTTVWTKKFYSPWPPKLILVPAISFRVKNVSNKPLRYVNFNAIYRYEGMNENLGDRFMPTIRGKALMPREVSDAFLLKSTNGVEGKNLNDIKYNPEWKTAYAKLFVQSRGSRYVLLGEWKISRDIDFKEPEPYPPTKKEEKRSS
jgi:hypothetical protein